MAATPSNNRLKLTPSNSPFLPRPARSPMRGRHLFDTRSLLSLKRVIGTTCVCPAGFDTVNSSFAYVAGAAVVVVDVNGEAYSQRFFRARPTTSPIYPATNFNNTPTTPTSTPKANDSRGRVALRDSPFGSQEWADSPAGKTWTSRERIKAATCLSLSRDGKYLAVGETGYAPRVLTFNLQDASSDTPLVSISEHTFGVKTVAWSPDSRYLASLGATNDGFLYVWKIDPRNGSAKLFQQNRCTSSVREMIWLGNSVVTLGVRHVKMWKVEERPTTSPTKQRFLNESSSYTPPSQRTLPGRNVLLGSLLEATFTCAAADGSRIIVCTEAGDVCTFDEDGRQVKLSKVLSLGFAIHSINIRGNVGYVGGKEGQFATLDVNGVISGCLDSVLSCSQTSTGVVAMGFLTHKLVTIDSSHSVDIWQPDHLPGAANMGDDHIHIPGHGESIAGMQPLPKPNHMDAAFFTWATSGNVSFWDMDGRVKATVQVDVETTDLEADLGLPNQLVCARVSRYGRLLITGDREGLIKVIDIRAKECLLDTRAHSSACIGISIYEDDSKLLMASCGRDRTTQLFHQTLGGAFEHFQTIEYNAKIVQVLIPSAHKAVTCSTDRTMQVHDIMSKEGEPDLIAAVPARIIPLKASPTSMTMGCDAKTIFCSLMDRSVCQFDVNSGRQISTFKCLDEGGTETAVLDSLAVGHWLPKDMEFLLGTSNTDKSIRLYDANSGKFLEREWGHTEGINGVSIIEEEDGSRRVVSVGSDATIMIWSLDLNDPSPKSMSRDPSPVKDGSFGRQTLRKVLSKAELAEFQRPSPSAGRLNSSPPRNLRRRTSRIGINTSNVSRTTNTIQQISPSNSTIAEDTPSRRPSVDTRSSSPPESPQSSVARRPSLPALGSSVKKRVSSSNLRGFGSLNMSTEQTCRTLRAYRKKLSSAEPISQDNLAELDQELRLTAAALGERAIRSKAVDETVLSGLLDTYSERLVALLDEKMRLTYQPREQVGGSQSELRSRSLEGDSGGSST